MTGVAGDRSLLDPRYPREPARRAFHRPRHRPRSFQRRWARTPARDVISFPKPISIAVLDVTHLREGATAKDNEQAGLLQRRIGSIPLRRGKRARADSAYLTTSSVADNDELPPQAVGHADEKRSRRLRGKREGVYRSSEPRSGCKVLCFELKEARRLFVE